MSHTPHQLVEEFPEHVEKLHALKISDNHFARLFDEYDEVNRDIFHAETNAKPTDDFHMDTMRKNRMRLKDEIYGMLTA